MRVALHVHTIHSACSESRLEDISAYCRANDIGAIGITDHNALGGGPKLQKDAPDLTVIIGEEISTRSGEVIGLFLKESVTPAQELRTTCEQIKRQGGLVYIPHPFDRFKVNRVRSKRLAEIIDLVDIIEVFNAKISFPLYNDKALHAAKKYGKVGAAGSDSHYIASIGSALNVIESFSGPADFLEKLAHAEFLTYPTNLLATWWVRARKFARRAGTP